MEERTRTHANGDAFDGIFLRRILGPVRDEDRWEIRYNNELYSIYDELTISKVIKNIQWACHIRRIRIQKKKVLFGRAEGRRHMG